MNTGHWGGLMWATLLVANLHAGTPVPTLTTSADVPLPGRASRFDYQTFDAKTKTLYVATESEVVSVFQLQGRSLERLENLRVAPNAHTVAVDSQTHEVYLPLKNVDGRPVLRIMKPTSP